MTVAAVLLVKDEADILAATLGNLSHQVDGIIVADNGSTDGSREIAESFGVLLEDDPDPAYYQAEKTTRLAHRARELGYDWVVPCDADELWYSPHFPTITEALASLKHWQGVATADLFDHFATGHDDPAEGNPVARLGYRRTAAATLPKVAVRALPSLRIAQGNHSASLAEHAPPAEGLLAIRHFPYRSPEQFARKARTGAAAYAATNLPADMGGHWRSYGAMIEKWGDEAGHDWFRLHFFYENPDEYQGLIFDPSPVGR